MGLLVHLGVAVATVFGNNYFNITGHLKYGSNLIAVSSLLLVLLRNKFLVPFMFLPSIFLSRSQDHLTYINNSRARIQRKFPETCNFFTITTVDNIELDAMTLMHPDHVGLPMEDTRWLIWFNPNGAAFEELLDFLQHYARSVGVSFLCFNYRGVARSKGMPETGDDLVNDGIAAMKYLLDRGVHPEKILMHGHSMGGAVAAKIRARYPNGPIINDRSFRSINHVVLAMAANEPALGAMTSGLVGAFTAAVVGGTYTCSYPIALSSGLAGLITSGLIGYKWGSLHWPLLKLAITFLGWNLDIHDDWHKIRGHKIVIYHGLDGVIHQQASLHLALAAVNDKMKEDPSYVPTKFLKLEYEYADHQQALNFRHQVYHVYPLDTFKSDWDLIVAEAKKGLDDASAG